MAFINIEEAIAQWESRTFSDWVNFTYLIDANIRAELQKQLQVLALSDKKINGFSVMGLERSQEGTGGIGVSYTETFFQTIYETNSCNLIDYLYLIVSKCMKNGSSREKTTGIIARGMRTFASLLRDHDFAFKIEQELNQRKLDGKLKVTSGSAEDAKNHTDVLVSSEKNDYRIWLFQLSKMGIPHDIERLTEQRGKLPKGIHIICPLKSELQMELGVFSSRTRRISERIRLGKEKIGSVKKRTKAIERLIISLHKYEQDFAKYRAREMELETLLNGNILSYHGWYLYGGKAVAETLDVIIGIENGLVKARPYSEVYDMLNAPKKYLSNLSSFQI